MTLPSGGGNGGSHTGGGGGRHYGGGGIGGGSGSQRGTRLPARAISTAAGDRGVRSNSATPVSSPRRLPPAAAGGAGPVSPGKVSGDLAAAARRVNRARAKAGAGYDAPEAAAGGSQVPTVAGVRSGLRQARRDAGTRAAGSGTGNADSGTTEARPSRYTSGGGFKTGGATRSVAPRKSRVQTGDDAAAGAAAAGVDSSAPRRARPPTRPPPGAASSLGAGAVAGAAVSGRISSRGASGDGGGGGGVGGDAGGAGGRGHGPSESTTGVNMGIVSSSGGGGALVHYEQTVSGGDYGELEGSGGEGYNGHDRHGGDGGGVGFDGEGYDGQVYDGHVRDDSGDGRSGTPLHCSPQHDPLLSLRPFNHPTYPTTSALVDPKAGPVCAPARRSRGHRRWWRRRWRGRRWREDLSRRW